MKSLLIIGAVVALAFGREGFGPGEQEWGFVEVREDAHIFYWLYYTTAIVQNVTQKPLVIWLQGGPGASSTGYGNFAELGPLDVDLNERNTTWVRSYNVMFVDNPVGSGFSYVENNAYATTNQEIAQDFVNFLIGFYAENPIFLETDLYIFCESYGGKMTAEIALNLYKTIQAGDLNVSFKGIGLGDSWVSPMDSVLTWAPYLLQLGVVDENGYKQIEEAANATLAAVEADQWEQATDEWANTEQVIDTVTYGVDFYNVLKKIGVNGKKNFKLHKPHGTLRDEDDDKIDVIMNNQVREALNISRPWGTQGGLVFGALAGDFMKPVTSVVEELLNTTDILVAVYNGQLDLIVDTPGNIKWVDALQWDGADSWKIAARQPLVVNDVIEGYAKAVEKLYFFWVNRAGHMVPADNPSAMSYILDKVTNHRC